MSGTLPLSTYIASLDRAGLTRLVHSRRIASPRSVSDSLDLAQELLKADSITQALTELTRYELGTLTRLSGLVDGETHADATDSLLQTRGLIVAGTTPLPEVAEVLHSELTSRGIEPHELVRVEPSEHDPGSLDAAEATATATATAKLDHEEPDTSGWFAQALTTSGQVAWMLRDLARAPAKLNRNGDVASVWVKGLDERLSIPRGSELVELVRTAGLATSAQHGFVARADAWLASEHDTRWLTLAHAAIVRMPRRLLDMLRSERLEPGLAIAGVIDAFPVRFPFTTETSLTEINQAAALWERLGITAQGRLSHGGAIALRSDRNTGNAPGAATLDSGTSPDDTIDFPATAPGIYIQPDLSVVVPGPLTAHDEAALAAITVPEQLGVASTLRVTEASLGDAIDRGADVQAIRDMLTRLTVSGMPQPLDYLITALGERAGSVVVTPEFSEHGRSRIDFANVTLRGSILVDRRLAHLQLHELTGNQSAITTVPPLISRLRADHVMAALLDARYPAKTEVPDLDTRPISIAEVAATTEVRVGSHSLAAASENAELSATPDTPLDELVERVLNATADSPSEISRQVTLAIRDKSSIRVTVEIRGQVRDFTIVPVSLSSGRMRALDEAAGVERTLPLEAITAVAPLT